MGILFQCFAIATHVIFSNTYLTCFLSTGILFPGYMGYVTYGRDQERKAMEKINGRFNSMAGEIAAMKVRSGKKNG